MGKIADILQARGQLDEALKIRNEEELPVYDRLSDVRSLLVGRANLAMTLLQRAKDGDRDEAHRLLQLALNEAQRLRLPVARQIEQLIEQAALAAPSSLSDERSDDGSPSTEAVPPAPPPPPPVLEPVTRGIYGDPGCAKTRAFNLRVENSS